MRIVFYSNYLNHHQVSLADELYKLTGGNYYFIETTPMPSFRKSLGYADYSYKPYLVQAWKDVESARIARQLCVDADVALFGGPETLSYQLQRAKTGKLAFEVGERWLKKGWINLLSPRLLKNMLAYHTRFRKVPMYKLCCSAYAASDQYLLCSYRDRCYKWGYFTKVEDYDIDTLMEYKGNVPVKIMWCSRFIDWKHPELVLQLAERLKTQGYSFAIDMYGNGEDFDKIKKQIVQKSLSDVIVLHGSIPNDAVLEAMRRSDIFLLTSDKQEGWGAVVNEAMGNGCVLVGSNEIGSIPFLVKDGYNGCIFKSCNVKSLEEKIKWLLDHPENRRELAINGYETIRDIWSPKHAAQSLIQLIDDLVKQGDTSIQDGPGSKALPQKVLD